MKRLGVSFLNLMSANLIKKKYSEFSFCYTNLDVECSTNEAIDSFFRKAL